MALVPSIRKIVREAIGSNVPEWVDALLLPLNQFLKQVTDALSGNLSIENFSQEWMDITVIDGVSTGQLIFNKLGSKEVFGITVERVELLPTSPGVPVSYGDSIGVVGVQFWEPRQVPGKNGGLVAAVVINKIVGLPSGSRATIRLLAKAR